MKTLLIFLGLALGCGVVLASTGGQNNGDKPSGLVVSGDYWNVVDDSHSLENEYDTPAEVNHLYYWEDIEHTQQYHKWTNDTGTNATGSGFSIENYWADLGEPDWTGAWVQPDWDNLSYSPGYTNTWTYATNATPVSWEYCSISRNTDNPVTGYGNAWPYNWWVTDETEQYSKTVSTSLKLYSGGRGLAGSQLLNVIAGSAQHNSQGPGDPAYFHAPEEIQLLGGTLHTDPDPDQQFWGAGSASLYYVTTAGAGPINATPTIDGDSDYGFYITCGSRPFTIQLSTSTTNADLSTSAPEVCVGQNVSFDTSWDGHLPGDIVDVPFLHWHLPGTFVNEQYWYVTNVCLSYRFNPDLLTNWGTACWFYDALPVGACSIGVTLHMSNGQFVNIAAAGSFSVFKPSVNFSTVSAGPVNVYPNGGPGPSYILDSGGVEFKATITSTNFSGAANWVQLVNAQIVSGAYNPITTSNAYWLDNDRFYNTISNAVGTPPTNTIVAAGQAATITFGDDPQVGCYPTSTSASDSFQTYLTFNPDPDIDDIWVTLGIVNWGWFGDASVETNGIATLVDGDIRPKPAYTPADGLPVWQNVLHNTQ